tara:strand:- start:1474 stop:2484 length:1011 start_codon:yes stop_codon:yes gene_type:complete
MTKNNFLIILPSWIGDIVISQALLKKIQEIHKNCKIDVVVKPYFKPLVKLMPEIDEIYSLDIPHGKLGLSKRIKLAQKLKNKYSYSIILTNSFKSALIPWLSNIPKRIGYSREMRGFLLTTAFEYKKHTSSMVNRYMKLINAKYDHSMAPSLHIDEKKRTSILDKYNLVNQDKIIVLCPDAEFGPAKRWPIKYWRELIKILNQDGFIPIVLGKNTSLAEEISSDNTLQKHMLIGSTNLEEAIYILSSAEVVISNDSGLMHVASAVESKKLVSLFGSSSPTYTAPLSKQDNSIIMYKSLSCSPCFKKECPLDHFDCMNQISPHEVYSSICNNLFRAD